MTSQSGGQKADIQVSAGLVSSERWDRETVHGCFLASGALLAISGVL